MGAWGPAALLAWSVGLPVAMLSGTLANQGGPGVAQSMGGHPADQRLTELAQKAAAAVGVPPPQHVFEIPRREPNAFAASGFGSSAATVAVTSGLRDLLTTRELSAVLAHEMGHLRHHDVGRNMHVAVAVAGLGGIYETGRILASSRSDQRDDDTDDSGQYLGLGLMALGLGAQGVARVVQLCASRGAELRADLAAADAFGAESLITALRKIDDAASRRPSDLRSDPAGQQMAFAMISDGASPKSDMKPSFFDRIERSLRTHPPIEERIIALERAAASGIVPSRPRDDSWW